MAEAIDLLTYVCAACGAEQTAPVVPSSCKGCGATGLQRDFPTRETLTIREQNDRFRAGLASGEGCLLPGTVVVTAGIRARGRDFETEAYLAVAKDTAFTEDNDPWGDHDFGVVTVKGERLYWKIDLYDRALEYGSPEPTDPAKTHRILTVLFPSEY